MSVSVPIRERGPGPPAAQPAPILIWRSGPEGRCDFFNEAWLSFTGRPLQEELGDGWLQGVHPDDMERRRQIFLDYLERRAPFEVEYRLKRGDGAYRYLSERGAPFTDDQGQFAGYLGSCVDIDARWRADQVKATFVSMMAHDLKTPLTAMRGYIEGLRRQAARGEPLPEEVFRGLLAQVERFASVVQDLSDSAQREEGTSLPLRFAPMDLRELLKDAVTLHRDALAAAPRSDYSHVISLDMPAEPVLLKGDRRRLEQAVACLLDNAIKYSPEGGVIRVVLSAGADLHTLTISDEGIGVPQAELPLLTRRYYRGSNAAVEKCPGAGLGLTLCKQIVERHGGRVEIRGEPTGGTAVSLELPADQAP